MTPAPIVAGAAARHDGRLDRDRSLLLVVDIQERLAPCIHDRAGVVARSEALLAAARLLRIPCLLTEHCADRIGPVIPSLRERFDARDIFGKTRFAATEHPEFTAMLRGHGRPQVVVAGMEAHVCVLQTVLGLRADDFEVFVVGDAVGSRAARDADRAFALDRMRAAGCAVAGAETVLFEWTRAGDDPAFRDVLALVKQLPGS
jgi:nicotinamidase-related amidase